MNQVGTWSAGAVASAGGRPELTIDLDSVAGNWRLLRARHDGAMAAVVKADAYGLGAAAVVPVLYAAGARFFFVAYAHEGALVRAHAPDAAIALLNGFDTFESETCLACDLWPVLGSLPEIAAWRALARRQGRALPALLHVDTGMNRLGLAPADVETLAGDPALLAGIDVRCVMTHLAHAEQPSHPANPRQLARFRAALAHMPAAMPSIAASAALFLPAEYRVGLARPGAALYGINPVPGRPNPLRPTVRLTACVAQLRDVPAGETVGYNGIWTARRPSRIATVRFGYADGYHRAAGNRGAAFFDGARLPLIGRVSMDLTTFDATDRPDVRLGDRIELIGPAVPPDEVAAWAGTNAYEVLTALGARPVRQYRPL